MSVREAMLVLADGTTFEGEAIGADAEAASGEVVFNTVLSGYQEVLSDPSYAGQIVAFTYPHIGNYGVNVEDDEARRPFCRGVIVRDLARRHSNWRAEDHLDTWLRRHDLPGIAGVDTRRLTRHIREVGAMPGAFGTGDETTLKQAASTEPGTEGLDLVSEVTTDRPYTVGDGPLRVVALDFGIKRTMVRHLGSFATVDVVPASSTAADVLERRPDGVFLSNGPGDPATVPYAVANIRTILEAGIPTFGICLGHQLLGAALGGSTYKLTFGHHGGNHPVRNLATGQVEITSQNHNFAVADVEAADVSHVNLNDGVVEGIRSRAYRAFGVQYHPEAAPGPHDSRYLFAEFAKLMTE